MGSYDHQSSWSLTKALYMVLNACFGKMFFNLQKSYIALLVFLRTPYLKGKYLICLSVSNYFLSLLIESGLKLMFHWKTQFLITVDLPSQFTQSLK